MVEAASAVADSQSLRVDIENLGLNLDWEKMVAGVRRYRWKVDSVPVAEGHSGSRRCERRWVLCSYCRPYQSLHRHHCAAQYQPLDLAGIVGP